MSDDAVDQLLNDLDRALSVQPSPALAAKVRRRIEEDGPSLRIGWRHVVATAVMITVCAVSYATWTRLVSAPSRARAAVTNVARTAAEESDMPVEAPASARTARVPGSAASAVRVSLRPREARRGNVAAARESVPVISPSDRLGWQQLQVAVAMGRITAESFGAATLEIHPTIVIPAVVVVQPVAVDTGQFDPPGGPASGGADAPSRPAMMPAGAPLL